MLTNTRSDVLNTAGQQEKATISIAPTLIISTYQRIFIPCFNKAGALRIAIRSYNCNHDPFFCGR